MSKGTMRVLCFGDSLTAGYWENGRRFHPYANEAMRLLGGVKIDHVGLCGYALCRCARFCGNGDGGDGGGGGASWSRRRALTPVAACAPPLPW
jgi:hypothetical protein